MAHSEEEYKELEETIASLRRDQVRIEARGAALAISAELTQARMDRLLDHLAVCNIPAPVGYGYCLAPGGTVRCHHFCKQVESTRVSVYQAG